MLRAWLGISGTVFEWFKSYLTNRFQFVCLGKNQSEPTLAQTGPILFRIYMLPLGEIICKFHLGFHCYADYTQIYVSMHTNPNLAITVLTSCLDEIKA